MRVEDILLLRKLLHAQNAGAAQYVCSVPGGQVDSAVYSHHFDMATLQYAKIGKLLSPWDTTWDDTIESLSVKDGDGLGASKIAKLISGYKRFEARMAKENKQ